MVTTCIAVGCQNRQDQDPGKSFHRFPTDPERRSRWVAAVKREGKSDDPLSPNYVPSQFQYVSSPQKKKSKVALETFNRRLASKKRRRCAVDEQEGGPQIPDIAREISIQTDPSMTDIEALQIECQQLRTENIALREKLDSISFDQKSLEKDDKKVNVLTGLNSYAILMCLYNLLSTVLRPMESLSVFQQILITLLRLRFNMNMQYLGFLYSVRSSTMSRLFQTVTDVIYAHRHLFCKTIPTCFQRTFPKCACIIDCFKICIEKPSDFKARTQTYSDYKSHDTAKYFIGISPQGVIIFISKGYGGRASDKFITEDSGFLNNIHPGDTILADRGFDLKDTFGYYGAKLEIPTFTKGKKQLYAVDIEKTRQIASVRIHVERVKGVTRQKYTMLESIIPVTAVHGVDVDNINNLDKIVHVSCALVNMCPSVIPKD
ncbi:uncharacterized protein LOC143251243 [Tachypleus tridentatus]|uniref:uncharacterized protein LOC143251243 n=1 Tax=Tachypleus tridentatus TaxID=6853 RepID=UPI003FD0E622